MGGGGRGGRSRTQRKHFREQRENVWKRSKSDNPDTGDGAAGNDNGSTNTPNDQPFAGWAPFATQNPAFNDYYMGQGIVLPEEWDKYMLVLRKPLPAAFRVNSSSQFCSKIRSQLVDDFSKSLSNEVTEDGELDGIKALPWYPDCLAWQSNYSRMQLRKNQTLERFHGFLKQENEIGNITRQEAVSMVPPLFLDVRPEHYVLDMCAAPGSKTFQLLEIIHQSGDSGELPAGMVVANDVDVQRCNLLIHQTKRMCTANLIVTNHEAQQFPSCRLKKKGSDSPEVALLKESSVDQLIFDRVLCDVPCSGDGTLRKAPDIWRKWNVGMGNGIHSLQLKIAMQGISLLKVGGRMIYSTCSMNPVENEAVVAEILRRCGGTVELVDVSGELPQLIRRPGLKTWKIRDKGTWYHSHKDVPKYRRSGIFASMFPSGKAYALVPSDQANLPTEERSEDGDNQLSRDESQPAEVSMISTDASDVEICDLPLERAMRILPHDQNSGAFFIAVLQKNSPLPAKDFIVTASQEIINPQEELPSENGKSCIKPSDEPIEAVNGQNAQSVHETDEKSIDEASDAILINTEEPQEAAIDHDKPQIQGSGTGETRPERAGGKRKLQVQGRWRGVDPVVFFKDEALLDKIKNFYGIDDSFPFDGHLVTRNIDTSHVKRIYYISKSVKETLELNFLVGQQLKITSIGMKMFERQTSKEGTSTPCTFRVSSEGLPVLLPYITRQILNISLIDLKHLLQYKSIKFKDFVDTEFGEKAANLMMGCCILVLKRDEPSIPDTIKVDEATTIAIGCWKGRGSITVMVTAVECQELLERHLGQTEAEKLEAKSKTSNVIKADEGKETHDDIEMDEDNERRRSTRE